MYFDEDWRHIKKEDIEIILTGEAEDWLEDWFNYHLKMDGHYCRLCNKRVEEVLSNYNINFHNNNRLWTESEKSGRDLLELAREITGEKSLSSDKVLDGVYCANINEYTIVNIDSANNDRDSENDIKVFVEKNLFSNLGVMEIVESLSHRNEDTEKLEMISFEWDVNNDLLLKDWRKAGYPLNWSF